MAVTKGDNTLVKLMKKIKESKANYQSPYKTTNSI